MPEGYLPFPGEKGPPARGRTPGCGGRSPSVYKPPLNPLDKRAWGQNNDPWFDTLGL
ncbi:hypothetical protein YIM730264_00330 [Thermus hydrothermalis]